MLKSLVIKMSTPLLCNCCIESIEAFEEELNRCLKYGTEKINAKRPFGQNSIWDIYDYQVINNGNYFYLIIKYKT